MNTFQYVLYSHSLRGTEIAETESQWPYLPKPKPELPPGFMWESLYTMIDLHKQDDSDMIICFFV